MQEKSAFLPFLSYLYTPTIVTITGNAGWSGGKVIAFEPVPFNIQVIKKQIDLNELNLFCRVESLAISNLEGKVSFVIPDRNANAHLTDLKAPHVKADGEIVEVNTITLDKYVANNPWPSLIKMDIEGAEVAALQGAYKLLSSPNAPKMLVSTHSESLDAEVQKILMSHGYEIIHLSGFKQMVYARRESHLGHSGLSPS